MSADYDPSDPRRPSSRSHPPSAWDEEFTPTPRGATPQAISERRVYRAGDEQTGSQRGRRTRDRRERDPAPLRPTTGRPVKRSPILAVFVLIAIAVVIALAGVAARDGGLEGSQSDTGTFQLLPLTTTTTS